MQDWHEDFLIEYRINFPLVTNRKIRRKEIFKGISLPVVKYEFEEFLRNNHIPIENVEILKVTVNGNVLFLHKKRKKL